MVKGSRLRGEKALWRRDTKNFHIAHYDETLRMYLCNCMPEIEIKNKIKVLILGKRRLKRAREVDTKLNIERFIERRSK